MDVFGDVRMSRPLIALLALPVSLFAGATGAAQTAEPSTKAAATAILRGRVVAADSGQPLRRAQIHIMAMEGRFPRTTTTDASGRYEFTELPGARYTVMASKGGYVQLSYGQTRSLGAGKPVEILDGRTVEDIDFALPPGRGDHGPRRRRARQSGGGGGGGDPPSTEHRWSASTGARWERRHERRPRRVPAFRHFARPVLPVGRREQSGCRPAAGHRRTADLRDDVFSQRHRPRRGAASVDRHRRDDERCDRRSGARAQGSDHGNRRRLAGPSDGRSGPPDAAWPQCHRLRRVRQGADSPGRFLHDRACDSGNLHAPSKWTQSRNGRVPRSSSETGISTAST